MDTISSYKQQAKNLRLSLANDGQSITHSESLERLAKLHGFHDWNTLSAKAKARDHQLGDIVQGKYLGHDFHGKIIAVRKMGSLTELTIDFDKPVVVANLGGVEATRKRVRAKLTKEHKTIERISNGQPHMMLEL